MITGQGQMETTPAGANRESNIGRGRFDLLPYEALEAWAIWSELGAEKYGPRNWEKGLLVSDCINRLVRHAIKAANGWTDEDHLGACMWNAGAAKTMMKRRPDLNDHPWQTPPKGEKTGNHTSVTDADEIHDSPNKPITTVEFYSDNSEKPFMTLDSWGMPCIMTLADAKAMALVKTFDHEKRTLTFDNGIVYSWCPFDNQVLYFDYPLTIKNQYDKRCFEGG